MRLLGPVIGGVIAGVIGAAGWAALAYYAEIEIGWVAWLIGGMVGFGVLVGARMTDVSDGSARTGVLAMVLAVLSIAAGKYVSAHMFVEREKATVIEEARAEYEKEELKISLVADLIIEERQAAGEELDLSPEVIEGSSKRKDYPPEIWAEADRRWSEMPPAEREELVEAHWAITQAAIDGFLDSARGEVFKASFGALDLLFFFLAVATAYKVGSAGVERPA